MAAKKKAVPEGAGPEKVLKAGIAKDDARYIYYVEKNGDVVRMQRGVARAPTEVILKTGIRREKGWMYYLDADGDLAREPDND
ncbi:MAG: hypothetical protein AB2A00_35810 [Myxococcota bacterium]